MNRYRAQEYPRLVSFGESPTQSRQQRDEQSFVHAPFGMETIDLDGRVIKANSSLCRLLGYDEQTLVNTQFDGRSHPTDQEPDKSLFQRLAHGDIENYAIEKRELRRDGNAIWVKIHRTLVRSQNGSPIYILAQHVDINGRKLAEYELLRKTAEIEDLYQHAPCGYHSLDADGNVLHINDTELDWLGYRREEVVGRMTALDLLHPAYHEAFAKQFPTLKHTGQLRDVETDLRRKDGSILPVLLSSIGIFEPSGRFLGTRTVLTDNSVRKQLEQERVAYLARLHELSQHVVEVHESERRQLASELHDRASPNLAALDITLANLRATLPQPVLDAASPLLEDMQALLIDMTVGIREICTDLRPATLDYAGLVPALQEYASQFSRRNHVTVQLDTSRFRARISHNMQSCLFRIAQEALTNCGKHASAVTVRIGLESDSDSDSLKMIICDDGIGFDPKRLGSSGSSPGLGLITMRERAEFAGGSLTISSHPGEGTEVSVTFARLLDNVRRIQTKVS